LARRWGDPVFVDGAPPQTQKHAVKMRAALAPHSLAALTLPSKAEPLEPRGGPLLPTQPRQHPPKVFPMSSSRMDMQSSL
jgi:hypothetical protein